MRSELSRCLLVAAAVALSCDGGGGGGGGTEGDAGPDAGDPPPKRIIALGDNHADKSQVILGLQIGGVIDDSLNWIGGDAIVVQTGRGSLSILALKPAGKREQTAAEFANGYHVAPGDRFQSPARRS